MDALFWGVGVLLVMGLVITGYRYFTSVDPLLRAAKKGDVLAQYQLAKELYDGKNRPQDRHQASYWCALAAEAEYSDAEAFYGYMHEHGAGGLPKSREVAVQWYSKAAGHGHRDSQRLVGLSYYHGRGIPQNYFEAYCWLNVARATGVLNQEEKNIMKEIEDMLDPNQLRLAQKEAVERHAKTRG